MPPEESVIEPVAPVETGPDTSKDAEWTDSTEKPAVPAEKPVVEPTQKPPDGGEPPEPSSASPPEDEELESLDELPEKARNSVHAARRRERQALRKSEGLEQQLAARPAPTTEQPQTALQPFSEPQPLINNFDSVEEHKKADKEWGERLKAHVAAETRQKVLQEQNAKQAAENQKAAEEHQKKVKARYEDEYDDLAVQFPDFEKVALAADPHEWSQDQRIHGFLVEKPGGLRTGYHLAKNPEEVTRIFKGDLDVFDQIYELETLRRKLTKAPKTEPEVSEPEPPGPRRSSPTKVRSSGTGKKSDDDQWVNG